MRSILPAGAATLALAACAASPTPEEKARATVAEWTVTCSIYEDDQAFRDCIDQHFVVWREAYREEQARKDRGVAMMGLGAAMMNAPARAAAPVHPTCNTTVQPNGRQATTNCF